MIMTPFAPHVRAEAIRRAREGERRASIMADFGIRSEDTLSRWLRAHRYETGEEERPAGYHEGIAAAVAERDRRLSRIKKIQLTPDMVFMGDPEPGRSARENPQPPQGPSTGHTLRVKRLALIARLDREAHHAAA
jgi:transposase-like protein